MAEIKTEEAVEKKTAPAKKVKTPRKKKETTAKKFRDATPRDYEVIIAPVVTEKSLRLMQTENKITVKVAAKANSIEIKDAFEAIFDKKVERVNIANVRSRSKRLGRYVGRVGGYKKAIVKLAAGETLDLFEEEKK